MAKKKIAVIGAPAAVMIYRAIGLDVYYEEQGPQIEKRIHKLADKGYAVIYITEAAAALSQEAINYYTTATFPAIIPIPSGANDLGLGMKRVRANVEKAVGADILFKEG